MVNVNTRHLLISDPPHDDVDAAEAAQHFGLTAAEVRMKANYGLPEIWFVDEDEATLRDKAAALGATGLNTVLVAGDDLAEIPGQTPADSFAFTDEGLWVGRDDSEWTMAYGTPHVAVFCQPRLGGHGAKESARSVASQLSSWGRGGGRRRSSSEGDGEVGGSPFLDIYWPSDTGLIRITIDQHFTDFSELPAELPHGLSAMQNLVAVCENRFENAYVDRRLVDMGLRGMKRVVTGSPSGEPARTGFSFATQALADLLRSLSPDLGDLLQPDLSSRIAYLTSRSRIS